jgi:hypothetical protein
MYFPLDPESRPKSTWQIGQATQGLEEERRTRRGGRRRPRDAWTGREGTEDWLNGGEEGGGGEGGESKGVFELKKPEGESRKLETRGKETAGDVAE